jgi:hypothetical protein
MYQFSRSIYRELAPEVVPGLGEDVCDTRMLFNDVRHFFPLGEQLRVYRVCERHMTLATEFVDSQLRTGMTFDGSPVCCHASTRRGTACARVPLPGSKYCPSHKHLDEEFEVVAAA